MAASLEVTADQGVCRRHHHGLEGIAALAPSFQAAQKRADTVDTPAS